MSISKEKDSSMFCMRLPVSNRFLKAPLFLALSAERFCLDTNLPASKLNYRSVLFIHNLVNSCYITV